MIPLVAKLKVQSAKNPNNEYWLYCLGIVHERTDAYKKAIEYYTSCYNKDASDVVAYRISQCHSEMGNFSLALDHIDNAIALDSTDFDLCDGKSRSFCMNPGIRKTLSLSRVNISTIILIILEVLSSWLVQGQ